MHIPEHKLKSYNTRVLAAIRNHERFSNEKIKKILGLYLGKLPGVDNWDKMSVQKELKDFRPELLMSIDLNVYELK